MEYSYKESENFIHDNPILWDCFVPLSMDIQKRIPAEESNIPVVPIIQTDYPLYGICFNFHQSMTHFDINAIRNWLMQFLYYTSQNVVSDIQELHPSCTIPDLLLIIANEKKMFDFELRNFSILSLNNLIHDTTQVSEILVQCNAIQLLGIQILEDEESKPLHLSCLKCLSNFALHCENCQNIVCESIFSENSTFVEKMLSELNKETMTSEHVALFKIFENISKYPIDEELVSFFFACFDNFMDLSNEILRISLFGLCNLVNYQSRNSWYKSFENSHLMGKMSLYLGCEDYISKQICLLFISLIYQQKQYTPTLDFAQIIDLLHYNDDINNMCGIGSKSSVRFYSSIAINEIIKSDKKFIDVAVEKGLLEACVDVFENSSFDVKFRLTETLMDVALHGSVLCKKKLISNGIIQFFLKMIALGDQDQLCRIIDTLYSIFENTKDEKLKNECYISFLKTDSVGDMFNLPTSPIIPVKNCAIHFLTAFFPKNDLLKIYQYYGIQPH